MEVYISDRAVIRASECGIQVGASCGPVSFLGGRS